MPIGENITGAPVVRKPVQAVIKNYKKNYIDRLRYSLALLKISNPNLMYEKQKDKF